MIQALSLTLAQIFSPPFRSVFWKAVGLTLALLIMVWFALQALVGGFVELPYAWLETALSFLTGLGLVFGLGFLVAPVSAVFAGLFLDELAGEVERTNYPGDPPGRPMPVAAAVWLAIKFTCVVVVVNLVALVLVLLPGINFMIFIVANGYLLGREYFEFAALRFADSRDVRQLRRRHAGPIFLAGLAIAGLVAIPVVNLLTPVFATALMVHTHKRLTGRHAVPADSTVAKGRSS